MKSVCDRVTDRVGLDVPRISSPETQVSKHCKVHIVRIGVSFLGFENSIGKLALFEVNATGEARLNFLEFCKQLLGA